MSPLSVLVVEDNGATRRVLRDALASTEPELAVRVVHALLPHLGTVGVSQRLQLRLLQAATGREAGAEFFHVLGERIWNQTRLFNLREGLRAGHSYDD